MGVYGLWKLLDASGKPVPLESLEGKVLAIDISIWIYQVLQGYQDRHGSPRPNAHLLGLFTRICKLLYYRIKPVFVFDGGVPMLKKNTIASRRKQKSIATSKAQKMKADLINNLIKHSVVKTVLNKDSKVDQNNGAMQIEINVQTKCPEEDMFALPDMPSTSNVQTFVSDDEYDSDASIELSPRKNSKWIGNIHNVDVTTGEFKALPADVRYDILTDLRETRKQNSWGRLHEMPEESQEFSSFQMKRLLKRRYVQESLESAEKEMGGRTLTLEELEKLLTEQGVNIKSRDTAFRIASDNITRLIYISDKNALAKDSVDSDESEIADENNKLKNINEEIESVAGPSNPIPTVENMNEYELNDSGEDVDVPIYDMLPITEDINEYTFDSDWESETEVNESRQLAKKYFGKNTTNPALTYMLEYSGMTQDQIIHLIKHSTNESHKIKSNTEAPEKNIYSESIKDRKTMGDNSAFKFTENYEEIPETEKKESQSVPITCAVKDNSTSELIPSSPESNNFIEIEPLKNNSETSEITAFNIVNSDVNNGIISERRPSPATKSDDVIQMDTSDSDSDDFIEIQDVPIPDIDISKNIVKKEKIEITIKSDEKLEDDMFADIFKKVDRNKIISRNLSKQLQSTDANSKYRTLIEDDNNIKTCLDVISEEPITEKANIELVENAQLVENVPNVCDKGAYDPQSLTKSLDQNNADSHTEVIPVEEHITEKPIILPTNEGDLIELKEQLENEQEELTKGIGKLERQATNISDQIRIDAQELLRLFGIPYVVAPMEAEAQCAYLEQINLTDGTITDDSDIWLFGGQCVYKNFFNNNKSVLRFLANDIQQHFKLTRNQLIQLALLVGSDYTTGIAGIGPVTALEILAAFPTEGDNILHGLCNFRSWIRKGRVAAPGKTSLRNKLRYMKLDRDFPSQAVVQAYLFPTIDESKETFTWGKPNAVLLCDYTRLKFGWTKGKFDNTMIPVLRRIEENKSQKLLDMYFKTKASPKSIEPNLSKRVQKALQRLNSKNNIDEKDIDGESQVKKNKKNDGVKKSKKEEKAIESDVAIRESKISIEANGTDENKKSKKEEKTPEANVAIRESKANNNTLDTLARPIIQRESIKEYIPQREKDKASALKKRLHAIEVFRKSKQGLAKTKKIKHTVRKIKKEAELSESDSD